MSKNVVNKEHLIIKQHKPPKQTHQQQDMEAVALIDEAEMLEVDFEDSLSDSQICRMWNDQKPKKPKRMHKKKP